MTPKIDDVKMKRGGSALKVVAKGHESTEWFVSAMHKLKVMSLMTELKVTNNVTDKTPRIFHFCVHPYRQNKGGLLLLFVFTFVVIVVVVCLTLKLLINRDTHFLS